MPPSLDGSFAGTPCAQAEVTAFQDECSHDLEAAEPIIAEAEAALNSLDKASLGELKSFGSPAAEVVNVVAACMVLTAPNGAKIPKVRVLKWWSWPGNTGYCDAHVVQQHMKYFGSDHWLQAAGVVQ